MEIFGLYLICGNRARHSLRMEGAERERRRCGCVLSVGRHPPGAYFGGRLFSSVPARGRIKKKNVDVFLNVFFLSNSAQAEFL